MKTTQQSKPWNIALWVAQVILAGMFLMAGTMKSSMSIQDLSLSLPWAKDLPLFVVRFIGVSEFLAGVGLLLPSILRIMPVLTPYAATGIVIIMTLASGFHIARGEFQGVVFNMSLASIALFIAYGRFKKAPLQPKNTQPRQPAAKFS